MAPLPPQLASVLPDPPPLRALLDLVYPRPCAGCGGAGPAEGGHLCWDCRARLTLIHAPYCVLCGDPVSGRIDHAYTCTLCDRRTVHFDSARSAVRYEGPVGGAIRALKYNRALWLVRDLTRLLEAVVRTHFEADRIDLITAVPMPAWRRWRRGFNQAELLGRDLAHILRKPFCATLISRSHYTRTQTRLTARERTANVRGAFQSGWGHPRAEGRRILLVDDVMTTGATVNECARALKACGAQAVWVATVARG